MNGLHIERMTEADLLAVHRIERLVFPHPWSIEAFRQEIHSSPLSRYFVARLNRRLVGYVGVILVADEGHITTLAVSPDKQRQGIGTVLLVTVIRLAIAEEIDRLILEVRLSNPVAQHLYEKFGFQSVGVRRGYYIDTGEDALLMTSPSLQDPDYPRSYLPSDGEPGDVEASRDAEVGA